MTAVPRETRTGAAPGLAWHALPVEAVLQALRSSASAGLEQHEAGRRLEDYGANVPPQARPPSVLIVFLAQFRSLFVYILLVAAAVSLFLGDTFEAGAVGAIVLLNAVLGFLQEFRSQRALEALRSLVAPEATAIRDGNATRLAVADIVPGDVLLLEGGDVVPADARMLEAIALKVSEALLTGESAPVDKSTEPVSEDAPLADRTSMVYQGAHVVAGRAVCIAVATGGATEMGRIAGMIAAPTDQQTPLQVRLAQVGRFLVFGALALCALVFAIGVLRGIAADEMFLTAASLAVAAIPEGLPAATTVVLALGVQRMARRNVIVRRLSSVETLGAVTVIFTDKTGTLTENRMVVARFLPAGDPEAALRALVLCNNAVLTGEGKPDIGDPTEVALLAFAAASGADLASLRRDYGRLTEIPFDSTRARMTVVVGASDGSRIGYMKGAPEVVLPLCQAVETPSVREGIATMAEDGLRVLALASRVLDPGEAGPDIERSMVFQGLVGLGDPLRAEAPAVLREATASGIRVVMLTGDHPTTAAAIGRRLGLEGRVITGPEIEELPEHELAARSHEASVFARVTSEHKLRMIHAARRAGDITAMTGDGVNDAPALRAADIGIAMGEGGTDVAREAADMVLMDNRFASIVEAIKQGRTIYANIQRFVHFLLACNLAEVGVIFLALLIWSSSPLTPLQILFVNLLTDGLPALALGAEPLDPTLMQRPPRAPKSGIISGRSLTPIVGIGGVVSACALVAYALGRRWGGVELAGDMALATLVGAHLAAAFVFRNEARTFFSLPANHWLTAAVASSALLLLAVYQIPVLHDRFDVRPLSAEHTLVVLALSIVPIALGEAAKLSNLLKRFGLLPPGV